MPHSPQDLRTFLVTTATAGRKHILQSDRMALLVIDVLSENRKKMRFLVHEFVIMPDHIHMLITPAEDVSLEKAVQYVKGGFSFRARRELDFSGEIWQESFSEHRIRDRADYEEHRKYVRENPAKRFLARSPEEFRYSSAHPAWETDPAPPWLKPS